MAAITQRRYLEEKRQRRLLSWQTRTLAMYIAATIEVEKDKENPVFESAEKIALDDLEVKEMEAQARIVANTPIENQPGSYEQLMSTRGLR